MSTGMSLSKLTLRRLTALVTVLVFAVAPRAAAASPTPGGGGGSEPPLALELVTGGLSLPVFVTAPPGDDRLFILEQATGLIRIFVDGAFLPAPFLDIGDLLHPQSGLLGEMGLLGMAFHPDFDSNGYVFVHYSDDRGDTTIRRYTVSASDPDQLDENTAVLILFVEQAQLNHNGGMLAFGPNDGMLYVGLGDGGSQADTGTGHAPEGNGQSPGTLLGKMLRLDVDAAAPYIPVDNPFLINPTVRDEIWAFGLRNPWRWSFDALTGDMYIGDVGDGSVEEIDFQPASSDGGENYGWRCMEGSICTGLTGCTCFSAILVDPIRVYGHFDNRCAVIGGYVYRGSAIPGLQGTYFYGDLCTSTIWSMRYDGATVTEFTDRTPELVTAGDESPSFLVSFGEDGAGELYLIDYVGGTLFKVVSDGPFSDLGCAKAGVNGDPVLVGEGSLVAASSGALLLSQAAPAAQAQLLVALSEGAVPFKGGVLKPWPLLPLTLIFTLDGSGEFVVPWASWPAGLPAGTELVFQYAIQDAVATQGIALSNGLKAITP